MPVALNGCQAGAVTSRGAGWRSPCVRAFWSSSASDASSYTAEERRAFTNHINDVLKDEPAVQAVLPMNPESNDLFSVCLNQISPLTRLHLAGCGKGSTALVRSGPCSVLKLPANSSTKSHRALFLRIRSIPSPRSINLR
jgi:hypothetical protein